MSVLALGHWTKIVWLGLKGKIREREKNLGLKHKNVGLNNWVDLAMLGAKIQGNHAKDHESTFVD